MEKCRALILDRDGVINVDRHYVYRKEEIEFVEGIFSLCRAAKRKNYRLIVTTNQSGIGRGYFTESDFQNLTNWMCQVFEMQDCPLDKIYYCPYQQDSEFRKPKPGMILLAAKELNLDLSNSISVGDKDTDVQAGESAGVGKNFLFPGKVIRHLSDVEAYL